MDWTRKRDFKLIKNHFSQLLSVYPFCGELKHYHTGVAYNLLVSMLRPLLPERLRKSLTTGMFFDGRLDTYYLVPDVATATQRILARLTETLRRRCENEKAFSL